MSLFHNLFTFDPNWFGAAGGVCRYRVILTLSLTPYLSGPQGTCGGGEGLIVSTGIGTYRGPLSR